MSHTEYLRTKLAADKKVVNVKNTTDASLATSKVRMIASRVFRQDGTGVRTLTKQTDRPVNNNASVSSIKPSGRVPDASTYTAYRGYSGIDNDAAYRNGGKKELLCVDPTITPPGPRASSAGRASRGSASSLTKDKVSCPSERGDPISDVKFVDNTISLSASHPRMVANDGCCDHKIEDANHTHSEGIHIDVNNQPFTVGKPFFMSVPPMPQGPNVSDNKVGGYLGPRSKYVENKHGFVANSAPVPTAPGGQGQDIAHLKINKPNLGDVKPS
jgi:hypothetical protein